MTRKPQRFPRWSNFQKKSSMPRCTEGLTPLELLGAHGIGGVQPAAWYDSIPGWVLLAPLQTYRLSCHTDGIFCNVIKTCHNCLRMHCAKLKKRVHHVHLQTSVMLRHSTGCQDRVRYMQKYSTNRHPWLESSCKPL